MGKIFFNFFLNCNLQISLKIFTFAFDFFIRLHQFFSLFRLIQKSAKEAMDKLLSSLLPLIVLLNALVTVNSAPMPSSKILSSLQSDEDASSKSVKLSERLEKLLYRKSIQDEEAEGDLYSEVPSQRQNKMIGYYPGFNPYSYVMPYASPVYYPPEFFDDFAAYYGYGDEEEIMSRTAGNRKRPAGSFKNSPIYYIRLPPTPYM